MRLTSRKRRSGASRSACTGRSAGRTVLAAAIALAAAALGAAPAAADTLHVAKGGAGSLCSQAAPCPTITSAVNRSRVTPGTDTIVVGPGTFAERVVLTEDDGGLTIAGAGSGSDPARDTVVQAPVIPNQPTVAIGSGPTQAPTGVTIRGLRVQLPATTTADRALLTYGPGLSLDDVAVSYERLSIAATLLSVSGPDSTFDRVRVDSLADGRAIGVFGPDFTLRDSSVDSAGVALQVEFQPGTRIERSTLTTSGNSRAAYLISVEDAVLDSTIVRGGSPAIELYASGTSERELLLRNVAIDARDPGADATATALEVRADGGATGRIAVRNSILLERSVADAGDPTSIACAFTAAPSQVVPGPNGRIDCGAGSNGNVDTTPTALFGSALASLVPPFGSPAIDSGDPAPPPAGASATDLAGRPRVADGNGDGTAVVDRGAYELAPPPPPPAPEPGPGVDRTPPAIKKLRVKPKRFRVARRTTRRTATRASGEASAKAKRRKRAKAGTTVSYRISEAARVVFTFQRRAVGRRAKRGRCVAPKRRNRRAKRCRRWVTAGKIVRRVEGGAQRMRFSGRIRRRALRPGAYRLRAVATDAAGNRSRRAQTRLRIVR